MGDRDNGDYKNIFGLRDKVTRNVVKALSVEFIKDDAKAVGQHFRRPCLDVRKNPFVEIVNGEWQNECHQIR